MTNTIPNDTRELNIGELDCVSGGGIKGAVEGVCKNDKGASGQSDAAQMFQQIMQQLTQG
jgi:hypothetical protein